MTPESMDSVFHALAHVDRRRILDLVKASPGSSVGDVCAHFAVSRIAVMKHLRVLEEAGLLITQKHGRTRRLFVNPIPIQGIHDRWVSGFIEFWAEKALDIKYRVESQSSTQAAPSIAKATKGPRHGKH
ncbi:MAG: helix-turn-helix transcriptional regulator [Pyrinomonadaceae bacterium]|nr:helix-turn-helix transcriptional regulator [Phycisphaerales bacterium]